MTQFIPVTSAPRVFELKALHDLEHAFGAQMPSEAEFDELGFELFRHNISPITQQSYRAAMITEIYSLYDEATADEYAGLLDQHWSAEELYNQQMDDWHMHEELRLDDMSKDPNLSIKRRELPQRTMGVRERSRAVMLATEIAEKSAKMRDLTVKMQTYPKRQAAGMARLLLTGWSGFATPFEKENGIVPQETYDALRAEIGKEAIAELEQTVTSFDRLSEMEKGNSASPLENSSDQNSSLEPSGDQVASDGTSPSAPETTPTANSSSPSGQIPETASGATIDVPSASITGSDGEISKTGSTQAETRPASPEPS